MDFTGKGNTMNANLLEQLNNKLKQMMNDLTNPNLKSFILNTGKTV